MSKQKKIKEVFCTYLRFLHHSVHHTTEIKHKKEKGGFKSNDAEYFSKMQEVRNVQMYKWCLPKYTPAIYDKRKT